jgi:hypothetical protein
MSRRYVRDSRGRFASTGSAGNLTERLRAASRAPQRITFDVNYHGTTHESAAAIKRNGWRESSEYAYKGPGVYAARSKKEAGIYAHTKSFGGRDDPNVRGRVIDLYPALLKVRSVRGGGRQVERADPFNPSQAAAARNAGRGIFYPNGDGRPTVFPKALADRMTDRRQGVVTGSKLRRNRRRKP